MTDFNIKVEAPPPPKPTRTFKVQVDNPIDAQIRLKARKTLDGNILYSSIMRMTYLKPSTLLVKIKFLYK